MLLRNIDQTSVLCNGTRLIVSHLGKNIIAATVVAGRNVGECIYIPRMNLIPSDSRLHFKFQRRQFPIALCFAITINKSKDSLSSRIVPLKSCIFTWSILCCNFKSENKKRFETTYFRWRRKTMQNNFKCCIQRGLLEHLIFDVLVGQIAI